MKKCKTAATESRKINSRTQLKKDGKFTLKEGITVQRVDFQAERYAFAKKRQGYSGCT